MRAYIEGLPDGMYTSRVYRGCLSKTRHKTASDAEKAAAEAVSRSGEQMAIYECENCGYYHICKRRNYARWSRK